MIHLEKSKINRQTFFDDDKESAFIEFIYTYDEIMLPFFGGNGSFLIGVTGFFGGEKENQGGIKGFSGDVNEIAGGVKGFLGDMKKILGGVKKIIGGVKEICEFKHSPGKLTKSNRNTDQSPLFSFCTNGTGFVCGREFHQNQKSGKQANGGLSLNNQPEMQGSKKGL